VVAIASVELRRGGEVRSLVRDLLQLLAPLGVVLVAWTLFRVTYYGSLLPNTYYAKAADHWHFREGLAYFGAFLASYPFVLALLALVAAGLGARHPGQQRLAIFATTALLLEGAFIAKVGGDFMEYRFAWQLYGLLLLGAGLGMSVIASTHVLPGLAVLLTALSVTTAPLKLEVSHGMQSLDEMNMYADVGSEIGRRFAKVLPADAVVATTLAGTIAYFGKRTVIDQWGLNDAFVAHQPWTAPALTRGHVKFAPLSYLQSRGVNLYIQHPVICSCARPCREAKPNVFVRLSKGRCMRSWYLTQKPHLTAHFCAHSREFVLNQVSCPPRPGKPTAAVPRVAAGAAALPSARP
jgi:arabinofuranosyltransferase